MVRKKIRIVWEVVSLIVLKLRVKRQQCQKADNLGLIDGHPSDTFSSFSLISYPTKTLTSSVWV